MPLTLVGAGVVVVFAGVPVGDGPELALGV
jgi:hypothetical protein